MRQIRLEALANLHLVEKEFTQRYSTPALVFEIEAGDDSTVSSDIRLLKKDSKVDSEIIMEEINNSRIIFLDKAKKNNTDGIVIGRDKDCDITIDSATISKHHAVILRIADHWYIVDCGTTNGSVVNQNPLMAYQLMPLLDNAKIVLGGEVSCRFYLPEGLFNLSRLYGGLKLHFGL